MTPGLVKMRCLSVFVALIALGALLVCQARPFSLKATSLPSGSIAASKGSIGERKLGYSVLKLRGGAKAAKVNSLNERKSTMKGIKEAFGGVMPATRWYISLVIFTTLVHCVGLPAPEMFGIDANRLLQLWRPLTSMAYLGGPSMSMANNAYFLVRYGQTLEEQNGTGTQAWFLLVQTVILSVLGIILGFPFGGQAMVSALVYISSHQNPMEKMPFQFGITITAWQLPFCMMVTDCLSQQNAAAAWPHVLGIFSGHCYHFFTKVWPDMGKFRVFIERDYFSMQVI